MNEIEDLFRRFIKVNPDGELNKKQFAELYISLRYEEPDSLRRITDYIFTAFDTDKNGTISFEEFLVR